MRTLPLLLLSAALLATAVPATSAGGPCDRHENPIFDEFAIRYELDSDCHHTLHTDLTDCPDDAQWTKTNEQVTVDPVTVHYTQCRLD